MFPVVVIIPATVSPMISPANPSGARLSTATPMWYDMSAVGWVMADPVVFTVDLRSHILETLEEMVAEFHARAPALCAEVGVKFSARIVGQFDPPAFDEGCVKAVRDAAEKLGYSHMDIVSGAGHDACWINRVAPTVLVLCPCVDGLSHNEAEKITPEWAAAGTDVLLHAVLEVAEVVG